MYSLLHGKNDISKLNIFIDETFDCGFRSNILQELASITQDLTAVCHQYPVDEYKKQLNVNHNKISFIDCFTDPFQWKTSGSQQTVNESKDAYGQLLHLLRLTENKSTRRNIFIDDLVMFARCHCAENEFSSFNLTVRLFHKLVENFNIFIFVHPNLISAGNLRSIVYLASFYVKIIPNRTTKSGLYDCNSLLRKTSGKVTSNQITVKFDTRGKIILLKDTVIAAASIDTKSDVDVTSDLTFNLRLTDKEKEARANTALPYLLNESSKKAHLRKTHQKIDLNSTGDVIYTPDDADDFDEEDPDDDLDF